MANMEANCERNPIIYGSKCHLRCINGYEIKPGVKQITLECLTGSSFSGNIPTCKKVTCNKHDIKLKVNNGKVNCGDNTYESKCHAECKQGYSLSPGVNSVTCQADKSWSSKLPDCADTTRPIIEYCPSDIKLFADARANYTHVTWPIPRAVDNSGGNLMIQQTEGPRNGSKFYVGTTQVKYKVSDSSGNSNNDCNFRVTIDEISCGWPILPDRYMNVDCPDGLTSGVECQIDCGTFEVVGNTTIFCEKKGQTTVRGEWNYGQMKQYCKKNPCEPLPAPANGAMACDEWLYGVFCQMQCMEGYDIPNGAVGSNNKVFTGQYVCSETKGTYIPSNTVPNCTVKRLPSESITLMEFFYYTGDCNNRTVQEEIRTNFITYIRDMNDNGGFDGICPDEISCNIANVSVSCGEISNRKKRAAERRTTLKVQFELQTRFLNSNTTNIVNIVPKLQNKYMDVVKESARNGTLDLGDLKVDSESFQIDEMVGVCDPGYVWKSSTISCVPCPPGTYLDYTRGKCLDCPIGTYKETEESAVCTMCPAGTSTISEGSLSKGDCKDTCGPGTFSKTGLIPCVRCLYNHYQDQKGATSCSQCPKGKITTSVGSADIASCKDMDILFKKEETIYLGHLKEINQLTYATWFKFGNKSLNLTFFRATSPNKSIEFRLQDQVLYFIIDGKNVSTHLINMSNKWNHVTVMLFGDAANIRLYNRLRLQMDTIVNLTSYFYISDQANAELELTSGKDVMLSGLQFTDRLIQEDEKYLIQRCNSSLDMAIFNMRNLSEHIINNSSVRKIIPSSCFDKDECEPNPCNGHPCLNEFGGYFCNCLSGFKGKTCQIPPDFCASNPCFNNGTCKNSNSSYNCLCNNQYTGRRCENAIIDGGWSNWEFWSTCSKSCESGTTERRRFCNNPLPSQGGQPCEGLGAERQECNTEKCPECPAFTAGNNSVVDCFENGTQQIKCFLSCEEGYSFQTGLQLNITYVCGIETSFKWNGSSIFPQCGRVQIPRELKANTDFNYDKALKCSRMQEITDIIKEKTKETVRCVVNKTCDSEIKLEDCTTNKREQETRTASLVLSRKIRSTDTDENGDDYATTLFELEFSLQEINNTEGILSFKMDGETYRSLGSSIEARIVCEEGQGVNQGLCIDCPPGTYSSSGECLLCDSGFYQDTNRADFCKSCPKGYSTIGYGATSLKDCIGPKRSDVSTQKIDTKDEPTSPDVPGLLLYNAVGFAAILLIGVIITIIICIHKKRKRSAYDVSKE
ncbi:sushi, von Willebrand factor type A, EGF and pentraxin domain-containing protein 1-like isoform X2 [Saccostrea cucullata]|uniref:sushi, von Willebrand factor type A, EGF and pentraxin domain-containing protein 1-like isoform X2 n=1 Tax=Saccostrea cuccullata TaxID=36930 RepID=UPI002ED296D9